MGRETTSLDRRLREFPDCGFVKSRGALFCTWCYTDVHYLRKSTIVNHLKSAGHVKRAQAAAEEQKQEVPPNLPVTDSSIGPVDNPSTLPQINTIQRSFPISVERRLREFPDCGFVNSEGILFCTWCCTDVDFFKRSIIVGHLKSAGHRNRKAIANKQKSEVPLSATSINTSVEGKCTSVKRYPNPNRPKSVSHVKRKATAKVKNPHFSSRTSSINMRRKSLSLDRRLREFPDCGFVKSVGALFCTWCYTDVNYLRKSTIVNHLKSAGHLKMAQAAAEGQNQKFSSDLPVIDSASLPDHDNDSTGLPNNDNDSVSLPDNDNDSVSLPDNDNDSVSLPDNDNDCASLPDNDNDCASLPNHDNNSESLPDIDPPRVLKIESPSLLEIDSSTLSPAINTTKKSISVERRLCEFQDCGFVNLEGILFCTWCCTDVDYLKKSTIVSHLESAGHVNRKAINNKQKLPAPVNTRQETICVKRSKIVNHLKSASHVKRKAINKAKKLKKLHASSRVSSINMRKKSISVERRLREFPDCGFVNSEGILFCTWCCTDVDFFKRSIIVGHLKSIGHVNRKAAISSVLDEELLQDKIFFLKSCIFCARDCSRCPRTIWEDEEKKKVMKLVFSTKGQSGFRSFFWKLLLGNSSANKMIQSNFGRSKSNFNPTNVKEERAETKCLSGQDATNNVQVLPVCTACLKTVVVIMKLHSDLERIQMLMVDEIGKIQRSVKVSSLQSLEPNQDKRQEDQFELVSQLRREILTQSEKFIKIPQVFLERFHCTPSPECNVNNILIKEEPSDELDEDVEIPQISPPYNETDNWSPPTMCAPCDDDSENDEDYRKYSYANKGRGIPFKKSSKKRRVGRPRKGGSLQVRSSKTKFSTTTQQTDETALPNAEISSSKPESKDISVKPKRSYRLKKFIRKSKSKTDVPDKSENHFRKFYRCEICDKTYLKRSVFLKHARAHKEEEMLNKESALSAEDMSSNNKSKNCSVCHQDIPQSDYCEHLLSHEVFRCEICNDAFGNEDKLFLHRVNFHNAPKIPCTVCSREYSTPSLLSAHMKFHDKLNFQCQICDRSFATRGNLLYHRFVHVNERPFTCEFCGFACKTKYALKRHHSTHEKKFECNVCGRKFARMHALNVHSKMHTDETLVCPYCACEFHSQKSWKRHVKAYHESENPLPMSRPNKKRRALLRWKDSEGNVYHAKKVKQNESESEDVVMEDKIATTQQQMNYGESSSNVNFFDIYSGNAGTFIRE